MSYYKHPPVGGKEGKITYTKNIVKNIVALAVSEINDVQLSDKKNGIKVDFSQENINVSANIIVNREMCVTDLSFRVQENIKRNVETMSEYKIGKIDINVVDILTDSTVTEQKN